MAQKESSRLRLIYLSLSASMFVLVVLMATLGDVGVTLNDLGSCKEIVKQGDFIWIFYIYTILSIAWVIVGGAWLNSISKKDGKDTFLGSSAFMTSWFLALIALISGVALLIKDGFFMFVLIGFLPIVGIFLAIILVAAILALIENKKNNIKSPAIIVFSLILIEIIVLLGVPWWLLVSHLSYVAVSSC